MPSRWTKGEVQFLYANHKTLTSLEIAERLEKTQRAVTQKATYEKVRCVLRGKDGRKGWTKAEIGVLASLAEKHTIASAAIKLGRTRASVAQVAMVNKISFHKRRITNQEVADILMVHVETVRRIRDVLGLKFRQNANTTSNLTRTRGATGDDIAAIAKYILTNEACHSQANLRVTAKHLRAVIVEWEGYE